MQKKTWIMYCTAVKKVTKSTNVKKNPGGSHQEGGWVKFQMMLRGLATAENKDNLKFEFRNNFHRAS